METQRKLIEVLITGAVQFVKVFDFKRKVHTIFFIFFYLWKVFMWFSFLFLWKISRRNRSVQCKWLSEFMFDSFSANFLFECLPFVGFHLHVIFKNLVLSTYSGNIQARFPTINTTETSCGCLVKSVVEQLTSVSLSNRRHHYRMSWGRNSVFFGSFYYPISMGKGREIDSLLCFVFLLIFLSL